MVELVDTLVLGTSALRRGGSTPSCGTKGCFLNRNDPFLLAQSECSELLKKALSDEKTSPLRHPKLAHLNLIKQPKP